MKEPRHQEPERDGFPDIISKEDGVWYSFPTPSLWESASKDPFLGETHHRTHSTSYGLSFSAEPLKTIMTPAI